VNVAARLEAHTKVIARGIAADGATHQALSGRIPMERFEPVTLKGRSAATDVYGI
jgi:class 3 adenylate cyclase